MTKKYYEVTVNPTNKKMLYETESLKDLYNDLFLTFKLEFRNRKVTASVDDDGVMTIKIGRSKVFLTFEEVNLEVA